MGRRVSVESGFFDGVEPGDVVALKEGERHYVSNVLRMTEGDEVELFDGLGHVATGRLEDLEGGRVLIERLERLDVGESPVEIVLFVAVPKGKRFDWLLEKATELGVRGIVPLQTERTVVRIDDRKVARRMERWEAIVAGAARQCGRSRTPELYRPRGVREALEDPSCGVHLAGLLSGDRQTVEEALEGEQPKRVGVWIGPEGDFTSGEAARLVEAGVRAVDLGPRILRVDTAAVVAVTLVQGAVGDLRG